MADGRWPRTDSQVYNGFISGVGINRTLTAAVRVDADRLTVELADGRILSVPVGWYPRLSHGSVEERRNWRLIGGGRGIHWPELDEDISVENLLAGRPSGER
ncbi:MAG: DUF2442 domain-containing protein [Pirellulales bacterium]|nr:DUF2442 domain-containing protein [Pirellulales bacterium]